MFERNDNALLAARIIIGVFIAIVAVASLVMGLVWAVLIHWAYILFAFVGWFLCWIMWVFMRLYLSYLVDIKLIRNKLYGESNEGLEVFLNAEKGKIDRVETQEKRQVTSAELERLEQLYMLGKITAEEYEKCKEKMMDME